MSVFSSHNTVTPRPTMRSYYFFYSSRIGPNLAIVTVLLAFLEDKGGYIFPQPVMFGLAFVFLGIGRIVLADRKTKFITESWRFFGFIKVWELFRYPFSRVESVTVKRYIKDQASRGHRIRIGVFLDIENKGSQLVLLWPYYRRARKVAECLAATLEVKYRDRIFGVMRTRAPGELNLPFSKKLRQAGGVQHKPEVPQSDRIRVQEHPYGGKIQLEPAKMRITHVLFFESVAFFLFLIGQAAWADSHSAGSILLAFAVGIAGYAALRAFIPAYTVSLTINESRVSYRYGLFRDSMKTRDIEELYSSKRLIHLVGDEKQMTLPFEVFDDEDEKIRSYIVEFIRYCLYRNSGVD